MIVPVDGESAALLTPSFQVPVILWTLFLTAINSHQLLWSFEEPLGRCPFGIQNWCEQSPRRCLRPSDCPRVSVKSGEHPKIPSQGFTKLHVNTNSLLQGWCLLKSELNPLWVALFILINKAHIWMWALLTEAAFKYFVRSWLLYSYHASSGGTGVSCSLCFSFLG